MSRAVETAQHVEIVKHAPDGRSPVRYVGELIPSQLGWIAARCAWVHGHVDLGSIEFRPGDVLDEYFSLDEPFNAFAILRPSGELGGWYCNVTQPTSVKDGSIHWHDLYVDVIVTPQGEVLVLDEDELHESGLEQTDPELHQLILGGRDRLVELIHANAYPFSEHRR